MELKQNGRTWTAELTVDERIQLRELLPRLLEPAGQVVEIRDRRPGQFWMEADLNLGKPVEFNAPHGSGSVRINRDGGGVSYPGCCNWYRVGLYPMPMPGDTKITIRIDLSVGGKWWPEEGPDVKIQDVHNQIRLLGQAIAVGWDPIGQPRSRR